MSLDLIHFLSTKFPFRFFKIFLKVPRNIFKIFWNFIWHLINFPNILTISEKNLPISIKFSSLFSKFNQKFFEITLKFLWLHKTFLKFSSGVLKIIFAKYSNRKSPNISSKFSLNPNKMFVKTLIEIKLQTITVFKNNFLIN